MKAGDAELRRIYDELAAASPATLTQVASAAAVDLPVVREAVEALVSGGLVRRLSGHGAPKGATERFVAHPATERVIGIDLGGTKLVGAIADLRAGPLAERRARTDTTSADALVAQLHEVCAELVAECGGIGPRMVVLAGPGVPERTGFSKAPNLGAAEGQPIAERLAERLGCRVVLDNDVNTAAMAEYAASNGQGADAGAFVFVAVGTGVGAATVIDGEVHRGRDGGAGEIGELLLHPKDAPTLAGTQSLEELASGPAMERAYAAAQPGWCGRATELFGLAEAGEDDARAVVDRAATALAEALAAMIAIVAPHRVVLGGGVGADPRTVAAVAERLGALVPDAPPIAASALEQRAGVVGAVTLAQDLALSSCRRFGSQEGVEPLVEPIIIQ